MRTWLFTIWLIFTATLGMVAHATAQSGFVPVPAEGAEWCKHAEAFLINRDENRPFRCATDKTPPCLKLNNYGCVKHGPANPYPGTPAPNGKQGAHDGRDGNRGHAIFEHPKWSVVASFSWFERSFKEFGLKTAAQLANRYSPWCDTQGSVALKKDPETGHQWGRSCVDGKKPPPSFKGPFCKDPKGAPTAEQCRVCNCPSVFVNSWLRGTNIKPTDPLDLFGSDGKPTEMMKRILIKHTPWEISYRPSEELIAEGARLFKPKP